MSAKKETLGKTIGVVVAVCLVCSIIVSGAAVGLRDLQQTNVAIDKQSNIVEAAGLSELAAGDIAGTFDKYIEEKFVNLETGQYVEKPTKDYDMYKAAKMPEYTVKVTGSNVGFQQRASIASVYIVKNDAGEVTRLILPVHGSGLWDLMYGFLAIDSDGNTVRELIYYQQKETPGLGGEVLNPKWKAKWDGKKLYNDGEVAIQVKKGDNANNPYAVDALSGATLTSNGVQNTLSYWVGENGYGPYLKNQTWKS
ncbi:Na(+)-translocating NADH-quinone reductase subunit C [Paraglaciecola arctica]|uniref:Na(+)-translocating NADH-quinone reductase subunit C n=1 Tax=Paraglaciecola arctica BSs20135 TaxID=493475 RepID=K6XEG4_9ALTE|nr:Na(+)-translocating NADH-quinone reductase subunit C [Paraglaciecola arctica]GAC19029.1 Na+-transporting NADH:ubiquinone oxidoreductase subunit C [Paraglaciecola arctica BSs20135]